MVRSQEKDQKVVFWTIGKGTILDYRSALESLQ